MQVSAKWSKFPRKQEARAPVKSILARYHQKSMFSTHQRRIPSPWHVEKSKLDKASLTCIWARISSAGSTIIKSYMINITILSRPEQSIQQHLREGTWLFSQSFFPMLCWQCRLFPKLAYLHDHQQLKIQAFLGSSSEYLRVFKTAKKFQKYLIVWFAMVVESPSWKSVPWTWNSPCRENRMG